MGKKEERQAQREAAKEALIKRCVLRAKTVEHVLRNANPEVARALYELADAKYELIALCNPGRGGEISANAWFAAEQWNIVRQLAIASNHSLR